MTVPVYERIVHLLEAEGINTLFGIPDPGFIHMAMTAQKRGWNVIAPHHEQSGGFMADAWGVSTAVWTGGAICLAGVVATGFVLPRFWAYRSSAAVA